MNNNPLGDFVDEVEEVTKDTVKGIVIEAKKQVFDKKVDPITNKPVPTKKVLTQLTQATKQLQQTKLQKIREELDKQRLKVTDQKAKPTQPGQGPELSAEKPKPADDAVQKTLRNSQSTGESRGDLVG